MLKLMPIPHVLQMNEVISTRRRTNDGGRCMLTSGSDVCDTQASDSNIFAWLKTTAKQLPLGCSTNQNVVVSKRNHHKHDPALLSLYNQCTITKQ